MDGRVPLCGGSSLGSPTSPPRGHDRCGRSGLESGRFFRPRRVSALAEEVSAALTCWTLAPKNTCIVRSAPGTGTTFGSGVRIGVHLDLIGRQLSAVLRGQAVVVLPLSSSPFRTPPLVRLARREATAFAESCGGSSNIIVGSAASSWHPT